MKQLEHLLVCLDLSEIDDTLIRYSNFMADKFKPKSITFLHVIKSYDIPPEIAATFPELDEPLTEIVKSELQDKIDETFVAGSETEVLIKVVEGSSTETIVEHAREHHISLTLMGKKVGYQGEGGIVRKVMGIIPSSLLLITETTQPHIENILVRMDFSQMSGLALELALRLQDLTGANISCHHTNKLPFQYLPHHSPESDAKMLTQFEKHTQKEYAKFAKKMQIDVSNIPCSDSLNAENDEDYMLYSTALSTGADLVLIGSKIKSELADIIIDSTSIKMASSDKNIPVLIVKDRSKTVGFLKSFFS